ncbi:hypothetical protein CEXT_300691 [Caerostris extrusa]|uniref:Methyltransferase type 11 domain-containing protein n=1 Tax=Caerostris extrusa TaxID=172846 RepID=A0AAV4MTV5_CAEEX|nr:hypothetical protein CEXT_300691 [Caerostris extrusa]
MSTARILVKEIEASIYFFRALQVYPQWENLAGESVMIVGCGSGYSEKCFFDHFPSAEKVIAIDKHLNVIHNVKQTNVNPKIEYNVADISKVFHCNCSVFRSTLLSWECKMSRIFSLHLFHTLNLEQAFENIHFLLRPGGEAAIFFINRSAVNDSYEVTIKQPEFEEFYQKSKHTLLNYTSSLKCMNIAEKAGLHVIYSITVEGHGVFQNEQQTKDLIRHHLHSVKIPDEIEGTFLDKYGSIFKNYAEKKPDGRIYAKCTLIKLLAKKNRDLN